MNNLIIILQSDGGMKFITGGLAALFIWGIIALFNYLKPKVQSLTTDISLNVNPDNVKALINKGSFEMSKNRLDSAIDHLLKAIEISPNNGEALTLISLAYHIKKDYINSKKYIEHWWVADCKKDGSISNLSDTAIMTYLYGHHHQMEGKTEQAQNYKESAIAFAKTIEAASDDAIEVINKLNLY